MKEKKRATKCQSGAWHTKKNNTYSIGEKPKIRVTSKQKVILQNKAKEKFLKNPIFYNNDPG